ncbi:hypothetical protein [Longimicrobium sp.]|uniref:hypothetical protein n=1 Tax=Longimicrobium sp. TaxID=2029185 RepID=UPI002E304103|nr:hypothetical protein [Longimicrobium sp.]HEX6038953.1 hypothetical protein [Longimicrobium sp.]
MDAQLALHLDATRPALSWDQLDPEELAVARVLRWGRAGALQVKEVAAAAGLPVRRTQKVVHRLLHERHWPIGTSMAEPFGNYLIDSADELEDTVELLRARGLSELTRAAALRKMTINAYLAAVQAELPGLLAGGAGSTS